MQPWLGLADYKLFQALSLYIELKIINALFYNRELKNMMTNKEPYETQALVLKDIHGMEDHEQIF